MRTIPTYVINLAKRTDRKTHVLRQFEDKPAFELKIVEALEHKTGAIGLWNTLKTILQGHSNEKDEFVLICEDDHLFSKHYSETVLFQAIDKAMENDADILLGGVSWLNSALRVSDNIYWVEKFTGLQFTILFRKFFSQLIAAEFEVNDAADLKISSLTDNKFFMYPFISVQKEFGYSDVTAKNNAKGRVEDLFNTSSENVKTIEQVIEFFGYKEKVLTGELDSGFFDGISLSTYILRHSCDFKKTAYIKTQFSGRTEFDLKEVGIGGNATESRDYNNWTAIRNIIEIAVKNDEDVIIICEDSHRFTAQYSKEFLIQNIMEAYHQGADILLGGAADFGVAVPVTLNRLWLGSFSGAPFLVVYKTFFSKILNENISNASTVDKMLSELTSNKMLLYPFISVKEDFNYSVLKEINNNGKEIISSTFIKSEKRLGAIQDANKRYIAELTNHSIKSDLR